MPRSDCSKIPVIRRARRNGEKVVPSRNSQADRLEFRVEITAVHAAHAFFSLHHRAQTLAVRIIDDTQRSRFSGENCYIDSDALSGRGVFNNNMPMLKSCAARFRFG